MDGGSHGLVVFVGDEMAHATDGSFPLRLTLPFPVRISQTQPQPTVIACFLFYRKHLFPLLLQQAAHLVSTYLICCSGLIVVDT